MDVHFQRVAFGLLAPAVQQLHQMIASHYPPRWREQFVEQLVFLGCQGHRLAFVADLLGAGVEADARVLDQRLPTPGAAPKQRT
ncbi:hypothetical protein D3C79_1077190 [compost metagenome]